MNRGVLIGRLTRDPEVRYTQGPEPMAVARFTLAVDRKGKTQEGQQSADFISCITFGRQADFIERYVQKGIKLVVEGRIQTGSYTNRAGQKVYTTDIVVENCEYAESKNVSSNISTPQVNTQPDEFMNIADCVDTEEIPFL